MDIGWHFTINDLKIVVLTDLVRNLTIIKANFSEIQLIF